MAMSKRSASNGFAPIIILVGILILAGVSSGIYFVLKGNPFATPSQNSDYYEKLTQQCERFGFGAGGCCRDSADRMRDGNFLLEPKEGCLQGFKREMLKCIETYEWCEPEKPTPTSSVDEATNWKTYTDALLNFSIQYPDNIVVSDIEESTIQGTVATLILKDEYRKLKQELNKNPNSEDLPVTITLNIVDRGKQDPLKAQTAECPKPCNEKIKNVSINNASGVETLGPNYSSDNYYLTDSSGQRTLRVYIQNLLNSPNIIIFRKIISTFKFTN